MAPKKTPNWISAEEMREWCNIKPTTEWEWRTRYNLHISKLGDKVFYDKNQIIDIMTLHSTYQLKTA